MSLWKRKKPNDRTEAVASSRPVVAGTAGYAKVDEVIAAAERLSPGAGSKIESDFDHASTSWGCKEILVLDKAAIRELLRKVAKDDATAGFDKFSVASGDEDEFHPPYVQLNSVGQGFRPYRIVKREDGQFALYGFAVLYQTKHAIDRAKGIGPASSTEDRIKAYCEQWRDQLAETDRNPVDDLPWRIKFEGFKDGMVVTLSLDTPQADMKSLVLKIPYGSLPMDAEQGRTILRQKVTRLFHGMSVPLPRLP